MAGNVKGLDELIAKLTAMQKNIMPAMMNAVRQTAAKAASDARNNAPSSGSSQAAGSSGTSLKSGITYYTEKSGGMVTGSVISSSAHSTHVEFGTGWPIGHRIVKIIRPKNREPYTVQGWIFPINGSFRVTKGMPPRPFMAPAAAKNKTTFVNAVKYHIAKVVGR